jgi:hypothetical protein
LIESLAFLPGFFVCLYKHKCYFYAFEIFYLIQIIA